MLRSTLAPLVVALALLGAACSSQASKNQALLKATNHGSIADMKAAVKAGAELDFQNPFGHSALHLAVMAEDRDKIRYLIGAGADPHNASKKNGSTPLNEAHREEHGDLGPWMDGVLEAKAALDQL